MILVQVADDRTRKGMVKISALVDLWCRGKRASREHDVVDSTEAEFTFVRKDLQRRRRSSHGQCIVSYHPTFDVVHVHRPE